MWLLCMVWPKELRFCFFHSVALLRACPLSWWWPTSDNLPALLSGGLCENHSPLLGWKKTAMAWAVLESQFCSLIAFDVLGSAVILFFLLWPGLYYGIVLPFIEEAWWSPPKSRHVKSQGSSARNCGQHRAPDEPRPVFSDQSSEKPSPVFSPQNLPSFLLFVSF